MTSRCIRLQRSPTAVGPTFRAWDVFRQFLLSRPCQTGLQVAAGELIVSLFFWRSELRYSSRCLLSTLYLLCSLLVPPDNHIGTKWAISVLLIGSGWLACLLAGATISIARQASGHGYTVVLCILAAVVLVPLSIIRASPNPVIGRGFGILTNIIYAVLLLNGQYVWPSHDGARAYWNLMVSHMLLNALIGAASCAGAAFVVLPSLAGDEVYSNVAAAIRHTGHSLSGYSSLMCTTRTAGNSADGDMADKLQVGTAKPEAGMPKSAVSASTKEMEALDEDWEYEACLKAAATGRGQQDKWMLGKLVPPRSAAELQPLLQRTKILLGMVMFEPAWLQRHPFSPPAWARLLQCLATLTTRVSCLEALLDERHMLLKQQSFFRYHFEQEVRPILMVLYGHMAAQCMLLADVVDGKLQLSQATCMGMHGCDHEAMQQQLWSSANAMMVSYWDSFRQPGPDANSPAELAPALQVRALAYSIVLTRGVMSSLNDLESALANAIGQPLQPTSAVEALPAKAHAAEVTVPKGDIEAPADLSLPQPVQPTENGSKNSAQGKTCWVQGQHVQQATANKSDPGKTVETSKLPNSQSKEATPGSKQPHADMGYYFGFLKPLGMVFLAVGALTWIYQVLRHSLLPAIQTPNKMKQLFSSRRSQFGLKFWFAVSSIMAAALILQQDWKHGRAWSPFYAVITMPIIFSERVEASISKGFIRIAGTAAGGILAYGVMLKPALATRSIPLAVILLAVTFLAGCVGQTQFKTSVVLSITAFNAGVLCQFVGCCNRTGTIHYYVQQIIPISIAVGYAVLINSGIKPWYASSEAQKLLAEAFESSGQILEQSYTALVQAMRASTERTDGALVEASKDCNPVVQLDGSALSLSVAAPIGRVVCPSWAADTSPASTIVLRATDCIFSMQIKCHSGMVQAMLTTDALPWSFHRLGLLTMPPVVHETLANLLCLLDRLAGLQLVVSQEPFLKGAFHGSVYLNYLVLPLDEGFREVISLCMATSKTSATVLCSHESSDVAALHQQIEALLQARVRLRAKFQQQRQLLHQAMSQAADSDCDATDDSCRLQSYLFIMLKLLDQFTRTAHSICSACNGSAMQALKKHVVGRTL
ncbi:hypothetical protein ABBQ38_002460 [Trebouxia sp. C0009 RCD-2024]